MSENQIHGQIFEGLGAFNLGIHDLGDEVAFSIVRGQVEATRARLSHEAAHKAYEELGRILESSGSE